ncbi:uncharacterized protein LOC143285938 [Babylonia areolata]|uniref:uncharacterized protein LOC143285938 n=1 Tax=Babylonia areolata TaxID=304850 RepID=UPI003FD28617
MSHTHPALNRTSPPHVTNYFVTWAATIPMVTVSLVTLVANGTVLVMFAIRPSLRRGKNAYIASLAMADFLIGCYMPLVALEELGLVHVQSGALCRSYLTVRYSLLYVSLLSVLFITLDRWWSLRWPFSYRARHTRRLAAYIISTVWALSAALYALPMFLWDEVGTTTPSSRASSLSQNHSPNYYDSSSSSSSSNNNRGEGDGGHDTVKRSTTPQATSPKECEVPYALSFTWAALTCCVMYLLPLVAMWIINCSLYHKIRQRKSVEIRRSTSVTDTFYVTVKNSKPTIHITEAPSLVGPPSCTDLPSPASPLIPLRPSSPTHPRCPSPPPPAHGSPVAGGASASSAGCGGGVGVGVGVGNNLHPGYVTTPNMARRHSSALVTLSPLLDVSRSLNQRRVSLPDWALRGDCSPTAGNNSSQCRYVGRKWSGCGGGANTPLGQGGLGGLGSSSQGLFGSSSGLFGGGGGGGPHGGGVGGRPPGEDLVHELLVKQDQKAACCLALLLAACTLCWLPFAFLNLVRANCPRCVTPTALAVCRWLLLANSAINPFLYGLLNAQFRNILRQWFYLDTSRRYRPRDTYIYMGVTRQDGVKETSNHGISIKVP